MYKFVELDALFLFLSEKAVDCQSLDISHR